MEGCSVFQNFSCSNVVSCERYCPWVVGVVVVQVLKYACLQRTAFTKTQCCVSPDMELDLVQASSTSGLESWRGPAFVLL
jgi:hypothetical protein